MRYLPDITHASRRRPGAWPPTRKPVAQTSITVSWTLPTGSGAVASYKLERSADNDSTAWPQPNDDNFPNYAGHVIEGITETMQEVTGLKCGVTYSFRVSARGGGSTTYADVHGPPSHPPAAGSTSACIRLAPKPTGLAATPTAQDEITVSWDTQTGVTAYKLERSDDGATWPDANAIAVTPTPGMNARTSQIVDNLTCSTTYHFRVSGKGDGSDYITDYGEPSDPPVTSSIPCPAPTPANFMVDDSATTQTSITLQWDTDDNVAFYKLERKDGSGWAVVATATPVPPPPPPATSPPTTYQVDSLSCGADYTFRVSAKGDGTTYSSFVYGATSAEVTASTTVKCTPQGLTITPLAQRRARLSWGQVGNPNMNFEKYVVQVVKFDDDFPDPPGSNTHDTMSASTYDIELDTILSNGEGLAHAKAYKFRVGAEFTLSGDTKTFFSIPVVVIDSPIVSANGNSPGAGTNDGKAALKWTRVETVLGDTDYRDGHYSFRYRRFTDFPMDPGVPHTRIGWNPGVAPPITISAEHENFDASKTHTASTFDGGARITETEYTLGPPNSNGLTLNEVYAIQLRYEVAVNGVTYRVFAGRDTYVWPSSRGAVDGERVATFPLNHLLTNKTYTYRVCEDTFPAAQLADWKRFIDHAFSQWESATSDLNITIEHDDSLTCEDYSVYVGPIRRSAELLVGNPPGALTDAQKMQIATHVDGLLQKFKEVGLFSAARVVFQNLTDWQVNEVYMIEDDDQSDILVRAGVFSEVAKYAGHGWCESACAPTQKRRGATEGTYTITTDIKLRQSIFMLNSPATPNLLSPNVTFNSCPAGDSRSRAYRVLVHEMGHALGIQAAPGTRVMDQDEHHPTIAGSVMSYESRRNLPDDPDCSPHPMDIMAIYAIYQTD